jgi:hypothetical protein
VCPNSLANNDPLCLNDGRLYARNNSDSVNCASCECPDGWHGVDCGRELARQTVVQLGLESDVYKCPTGFHITLGMGEGSTALAVSQAADQPAHQMRMGSALCS